MMRTIHPLDFVRVKRRLAGLAERDPGKAGRDEMQAAAVEALVERYLPQLAEEASLAQRWNAKPGTVPVMGMIVALSEVAVIQSAGRGQWVFWERARLQERDALLRVGESVAIYPSGRIQEVERIRSRGAARRNRP